VPEPAYYEAGGAVPAAVADAVVWRKPHSEFRRIEVPARVPASLTSVPRSGDAIEILWMRPRPLTADPLPLVLISPILSNKLTLMGAFASGFVRQGYSVAILPRKELEFDARRSIVEAEAESRLVVMRARQALDWLLEQRQVDPERVGLFGVSAGGIVGASMLAADPRIKAGVLVFAGGPMADVIVESSEDRMQEHMAQIQREQGWSRTQVRQMLRANLRTDPVVLAPRVKPEQVLMFLATKDDSVPTATQRTLWEALGRPEKYELSAGHYTGFALFLPFIAHKSRQFLGKRLGTRRRELPGTCLGERPGP
jgi:dienelactone hydrolase